MTKLPSRGTTQVIGKFIVVEHGIGYALGVESVKPGGWIVFQNAGTRVPQFQENAPPITIEPKALEGLICRVAENCPKGAYPFAMEEAGKTVTQYPYVLHIDPEGQDSAKCRMVGNKLRVVLTTIGQAGEGVAVRFQKELFSSGIELKMAHDGQTQSATIPQNQEDGIWTVQPSSVPTTYTFLVNALPSSTLTHEIIGEVVGSDEGDLDIVPP